MELVSTAVVGAGGASQIEFTNIPQDAADLVVVLSGRSTTADGSLVFSYNNSSGNFRSFTRVEGTGSSRSQQNSTSVLALTCLSTNTANTFGNVSIYIASYSTTLPKSLLVQGVTENNAPAAFQNLGAGNWESTAAVTSIQLAAAFAQHSTASLYKITKA